MKKTFLMILMAMLAMNLEAQSIGRKFTVTVSEDGKARMICFLPAAEKATGRAVVICPGGAYWIVATELEGTGFSEFFNSQGIACFVLNYRMPHGNRALPFSDAEKAIKMVRDSAVQWHVNPYDVGIMGSSAGGHLASTVSTHADFAHRPNFSILFYPVISMNPKAGHAGSTRNLLGRDGEKDETLIYEYSNEKHVQGHLTPPAILLLANDDEAVPPVTNAVAYYAAMRRAGNDCAMYIYPSGGHGFGSNPKFKYHEQMLRDLHDWLDQLPSPKRDALRVACIGNSITDGMTIDLKDHDGYPAQLQRILGPEYNVKNYGVSARTLLRKGNLPYVSELAWKDALAFNPNIAVIKLGTNDSKAINWKYKDEFQKDLQSMIDQLKALPAHPEVYLVRPLVVVGKVENERSINNEVIEKEIIPIINNVAKKNKLQVLDFREELNHKELMSDDGVHPNKKGAAVIARKVAEAIRK
ncbi:xylanase [Prevotella sp. oral taxon 376]|uniref:acetylxylan esterase AxeA1 n=1 Tax=Prevotella sp. oral taxon 376 TaxID=712466 RepID=UPI000D1E98A4|nr:acetylxylan esterase AxeA1 [Prevotella sp. oral taxon 376]PTL33047.1 xylanase [Prevotella sp. oral taxon 376]